MARYIVRVRYSQRNELSDDKSYILFEQFNRKEKQWKIIKLFTLEFNEHLNSMIMPVEVINYIQHLNDLNFEIYYDYLSTEPNKEC